jgi:hypothetical protein
MKTPVLDGTIQLRGVDSRPQDAVYFVNDLPGIEGELLANLTTKDAATLAEVWAKIRRRALAQLLADLALRLDDLFGWKPSIHESPRVYIQKPMAVIALPTDATAAGLHVTLEDGLGVSIYLKSVQFFVEGTESGQIELLVVDQVTDTDLVLDENGETLVFDVTPGVNKLFVDRLLEPDAQTDFFVGIRGLDSFDPLGLGLRELRLDPGCPLVVASSALTGEENQLVPVVTAAAYAPLILEVRLECSLAQAVEDNARNWAPCMLFLLGSELLKEKLFSNRTNFWASGNMSITEVNQKGLAAQYTSSLKRLSSRLDVGTLCQPCEDDPEDNVYETNLTP